MITEQQFKLFSNDPKLRSVPLPNPSSKDDSHIKRVQEISIMKVYCGCKPIRHKEVTKDSFLKKSNPSEERPLPDIDFIQSRLQAYTVKLNSDIEQIMEEMDQIYENHAKRQTIQNNINLRLQEIMEKTNQISEIKGSQDEKQIEFIEKAVEEIKMIYEQNLKLKQENQEREKRVKKKREELQKKGF